ncbi:hypothetical protein FB567DRAFT_598368 [Paraphoma chrysanthemicola]|uniref:Uncharacterized protein n=1 Tax=Paraphoma chrysanthemicola TaxID=798071 RepID=A0A8K0QVM6_9PLEO|nr:hypothetical protein FB567DRAFT_598368 [Paraphoma chrysanthemicola]
MTVILRCAPAKKKATSNASSKSAASFSKDVADEDNLPLEAPLRTQMIILLEKIF